MVSAPWRSFLEVLERLDAGRGFGEALDRGSVRTGHEVAVQVNGDLNRGVTELLLDVGDRLARLEEQGGVGVSEIVKPRSRNMRRGAKVPARSVASIRRAKGEPA